LIGQQALAPISIWITTEHLPAAEKPLPRQRIQIFRDGSSKSFEIYYLLTIFSEHRIN
jgi:hypothetical protein